MNTHLRSFLVPVLCVLYFVSASFVLAETYKSPKVVYDVAVSSTEALNNVLARASHMGRLTGADPLTGSIVLVMHGTEVTFFVKDEYDTYKAVVDRAKNLSVDGTVKFVISEVALKVRGLSAEDMPEFVKVVPFGDAEIARLQNEKQHAYIRADRNLAP